MNVEFCGASCQESDQEWLDNVCLYFVAEILQKYTVYMEVGESAIRPYMQKTTIQNMLISKHIHL